MLKTLKQQNIISEAKRRRIECSSVCNIFTFQHRDLKALLFGITWECGPDGMYEVKFKLPGKDLLFLKISHKLSGLCLKFHKDRLAYFFFLVLLPAQVQTFRGDVILVFHIYTAWGDSKVCTFTFSWTTG